MPSAQYVWHRVPENLQGNILFPLNKLKEFNLDLYNQYNEKYKDRFKLTQRKITPLNCIWNDVLFFCPVHPQKIHNLLRENGWGNMTKRYFQIPVSKLNPDVTTILRADIKDNRGVMEMSESSFESISNIEKYSEINQKTRDYFHEEIKVQRKKVIMTWNYIPHILYKGELDISDIEIITVTTDTTK